MDNKLNKLDKLMSWVQKNTIKPEDLKLFIESAGKLIRDNLSEIQTLKNQYRNDFLNAQNHLIEETNRVQDIASKNNKKTIELEQELLRLDDKIESIEFPEVPEVDFDKIKKEILDEVPEKETKEIVEEINELPEEPAYQIDAKHIKNLPKPQTVYTGGGRRGIYQVNNSGVQVSDNAKVLNFTGSAVSSITESNETVTVSLTGGGSNTFPTTKIANSWDAGGGTRDQGTNLSGGTRTYTVDGLVLTTNTTSGGGASVVTEFTVNSSKLSVFAGSPIFSATFGVSTIGTTGAFYVGIGSVTINPAPMVFTPSHIGFKVLIVAGVATLYGTQSDGTESTTSALTTLTTSDIVDVFAIVSGTTSVTYYYRKNGGTMSAGEALTTNIPTADSGRYFMGAISNNASVTNSVVTIDHYNYER